MAKEKSARGRRRENRELDEMSFSSLVISFLCENRSFQFYGN
jgi:hypothetical protein